MKRDQYWDSLKFVLIFFVVYGHTIESYAPSGSVNRAIYNLIYTFHMPLFIFVSGRFSQIKDKEKYKKGIIKLFETYLVFHIIWQLIVFASGKDFNILKFIAFPSWSLWYLVSVIWWRVLVLMIPEKILKGRPLKIIAISFFVSILGGVIPANSHFSLQRTMAYMPFFFMGYYSTKTDIRKYINKVPLSLALFVIVSVLFFFYFCLNENINFILTCRLSYWSRPEVSPILRCVYRCILLVSAMIISIMIMRIVPLNQQIAKWGANTLFIYMYHSFLIRAFRLGVKCGLIPQNEWLLIVYALLFTISLAYLSRNKHLNLILNPISYIKERR